MAEEKYLMCRTLLERGGGNMTEYEILSLTMTAVTMAFTILMYFKK